VFSTLDAAGFAAVSSLLGELNASAFGGVACYSAKR
jgi:hypothetical protein